MSKQPQPFRVMQSVNVTQPPKKGVTRCMFKLRCKGEKLDHRREAVQVVSINGTDPFVEWGCVPCARIVVLQHMSRLAKFQGFLIDTLNRVNAAEYLRSGITSKTPGYEPPVVQIHYPTYDQMVTGNMASDYVPPKPVLRHYTPKKGNEEE